MRSLPVHVKRRPGFTLLELLIVMAVIGLLMGLLLPAVFRVNTGIRRRRVDVATVALRTAIETYHARYRQWPAPAPDLDDGVDYVYGDPDGPRPNNNAVVSRLLEPPGGGAPLLELKHFRSAENGNLLDPWWSSADDAQYRIQMDMDYNGTPSGRVLVWSVNR